ncbi:MAG: tRNA adenosine(34) deaminase TadA [Candidatus Kapaibacterium sp.]|jgi:tRNA(adenine34) deaminase
MSDELTHLIDPASNFTARDHSYWMQQALREAEKAYDLDEVPVGCVIVQHDRVIAKGHNLTESLHDATAHAEMIAITAASEFLADRYLLDTTLYVTLEPCAMCAGAMILARIPTLVFGASDPKAGACGTLFTLTEDKRLNHQIHTVPGVLDQASAELLTSYFRTKRTKS